MVLSREDLPMQYLSMMAIALFKDDPLRNSYIIHVIPLRPLDLNNTGVYIYYQHTGG